MPVSRQAVVEELQHTLEAGEETEHLLEWVRDLWQAQDALARIGKLMCDIWETEHLLIERLGLARKVIHAYESTDTNEQKEYKRG